MSLIQSLSNTSAKWLAGKVPNTEYETVEDQVSVYNYGFQVVWGMLIKGLLLVGLSWLFGVLFEALIVTLTFSSFRSIAGGYHLKTYGRCISVSLGMFIISALIVKHTYSYWTNINILTLLLFTFLSVLYVIVRYVPRDNPNRQINKTEEIMKFKRWSLYYLFTWIILMVIFYLYFDSRTLILSSSFGLLLELFSISKLGYYHIYPMLDAHKKHSLKS